MTRNLFFLSVILLMTASCKNREQKDVIYYNKNFKEMTNLAKDIDQPFCIVLVDSLNFTSNEYLDLLNKYKMMDRGISYNFINTTLNENKWYSQLLSPQIYPVTCIFNTTGELIDLVSGSSNESILYINKVIKTRQSCLEFHYNQKYDQDKINVISFINNSVKLKSKIDEGKYVVANIDSMLQISEHPYLLYLRLQNQVLYDKKAEANKTAERLLLFDSGRYLFDYYDELLIANQILDSTYNAKTAPIISSRSNNIELPDCEINHTYNLNVDIVNKGEKTLKISDILTSCSCVELMTPKKHIINSGETLTLKVKFIPDVKGNIFRDIYIASNSLNTPIYTISINATVK